VVTTNEVTDRHGTGVLLSRIFGASPNVLSLRSTNLYHEHYLGAAQLCFGHEGLSRAESFGRVLYALNGSTVRQVLCVPFLPDELISALALKELFGAPLCTYVMDDNNIYSRGIPDQLMREALSKSALRLAISPEMRDAYEIKYGLKFWVLPPVVKKEIVQTQPRWFAGGDPESCPGVLVGSIWSQCWLEQLRRTVREAGLQVHWYGNAQAPWLKVSRAELLNDGIVDCGFLPETELTERLKGYPYALVPSGSLDERDDRPEIARLSLPTRLAYLLAACHTPMIVLGSPNSAAARFLERFDAGSVVPYNGTYLRRAVARLCRPETQATLRRQLAHHASLFSAADLDQWIWQSLERGEPRDERFEQAFSRQKGDVIAYLEAPAPQDLQGDHILVYQALRRLRRQGFAPDFVLDVGASTGVWSDIAKRIFPDARFLLVEPLHKQHAKRCDWYFRKHPDFECVPVAVSNRVGEALINVSDDLYGSSLLRPHDFRTYEPVPVRVSTLNAVARERGLTGHGLLKIDVQFAEHLVLAGAMDLLPQVDALVIELSLVRYASQPLLFPEMCDMLAELGFRYFEDVGGWRSPVDGTQLQKDVLFVRKHLFTGPEPEAEQPRGDAFQITESLQPAGV
jgi:FkbM family methyltransferase